MTVTAVAIALIEGGATLAGMADEPMTLVEGWAPTRAVDAWAVALTAVGCGALFAVARYPAAAMAVTAASYILFMLRDHEFGMSLPAMAAILVLALRGQHRVLAISAALSCIAASLIWVANRTASIPDDGVSVLAWVAFGTVSTVFFLVPLLLGELIRARRLLRASVAADHRSSP